MLEEVGYIRLYCTSLQLVPTLSWCKTLFFATVIPFHKLWVMHRRWSYFQMYLSLYWSRHDWLCAWVPRVIWTTLFTQCKSSSSVALWSVVGKPFFPCTYYWLLLAFLGWADGPYLKACSQMVLHTSLYSICLTSIGCGLSLSLSFRMLQHPFILGVFFYLSIHILVCWAPLLNNFALSIITLLFFSPILFVWWITSLFDC